jgi:hypothetical protein
LHLIMLPGTYLACYWYGATRPSNWSRSTCSSRGDTHVYNKMSFCVDVKTLLRGGNTKYQKSVTLIDPITLNEVDNARHRRSAGTIYWLLATVSYYCRRGPQRQAPVNL